MKYLLLALALFASTAHAGSDTYVKPRYGKALFEALQNVFPEAKEGYNHSVGLFLDSMYCITSSEELSCTGKNFSGTELSLEGGKNGPEEQKLSALWKVMKRARLPIVNFKGGNYVSLVHINCEHLMPGSGGDTYECSWEEANDRP